MSLFLSESAFACSGIEAAALLCMLPFASGLSSGKVSLICFIVQHGLPSNANAGSSTGASDVAVDLEADLDRFPRRAEMDVWHWEGDGVAQLFEEGGDGKVLGGA